MTREQATLKAKECERINGRPFTVVPVTYANGEDGFDVTPQRIQTRNLGQSPDVVPDRQA